MRHIKQRWQCFATTQLQLILSCFVICRSVVQFQYGEDGIDVLNSSFLNEWNFLSNNISRLRQQEIPGSQTEVAATSSLASEEKQIAKENRQVLAILISTFPVCGHLNTKPGSIRLPARAHEATGCPKPRSPNAEGPNNKDYFKVEYVTGHDKNSW